MQLNKTEKKLITSIVSRFKECWKDMETLEDDLSNLTKQKESLLKSLKAIRKEESKIVNKLKEKYGEDHSLDLETFEIKETEKIC